MKRLVLFIIGVICSSATMFADGEYSFSISQNNIKPGATATLNICMKNAADVTGIQCDITLPDGISMADGGQPQAGRTSAHTLAYNKLSSGTIRFVLYSMSLAAFSGSDGTVITLPIKANSSLSKGTLPVKINNVMLSKKDGTQINVNDYQGNINILYADASGVNINKTTATIRIGETDQLTATVNPSNADPNVTWSSSDNNIATVSSNGLIKGIAVGTAVVTATAANGQKAECVVTVNPIEAESIQLSESSFALPIGNEKTITATVMPTNTTDKTVTWASSNNNIATVSANGLVKAVNVGTAIITATATNGVKAECEVTVKPINSEMIILSESSVTLYIGDEKTITATVLPENTTVKTVSWASSDESVATVSENGLIKALSAGKATITASNGSVNATCLITVEKLSQEIVWEQMFETINNGDVIVLTATTTSGLPVNYKISRGTDKATLAGSTLTITTDNGIIDITAYQEGNDTYSEAEPVTKTINIVNTAVTSLTIKDETIITITNTAGQMIYHGQKKDAPNLKRGVYVVKYGNKSKAIAIQ